MNAAGMTMRDGPGTIASIVAALAVMIGSSARASEPTLAEEAAFRAAVDRVAASVVRIEPAGGSEAALAAAAEAGAASGPSTGTVVDPGGLILTTSFAVPSDASAAIVVLADGRRLAATPRGRDLGRGIVLLETEPLPGAAVLEPVPRRDLEPGQWTIAVGRAWNAAEPSVAVGVLSAVDRGWGLAVQTDAAVSPMNYGGPLVDIAGRVIGILAPLPADTAGMKLGTELYDAGIGFAVPLEDLLRELPWLKRGESRGPGILGIGYRSRDTINGEPVIASVRQGSPAARAGLRAGDRIMAIDGRTVARIADARHRIVPLHAGDDIEVAVERRAGGGEPNQVTVRATLAESLPPWQRAVLGMTAVPAADESAARVSWVLPGGPAATAGVVAGDTIESIAAPAGPPGLESPSPAAVAGFLAGMEPGQTVRLSLRRQGAQVEVTPTLAALPVEVPAMGPPSAVAADGGDPLAGPVDAAAIVRLEAADVTEPPLAVMPRGNAGPVGVLVYLGVPSGPVAEAEAVAWKGAVVETGVAVILPSSIDRRRWSRDDIPGVIRAVQSLGSKRPIDAARVGVAGSGAGGAFAWLVADRLGALVRGVAVADAGLPRSVAIEPVEPTTSRWILLGAGNEALLPRLRDDRQRLERAGYPVGTLPVVAGAAPPAAVLCRWVSLLGLL
jgi:serine protease Do